MQIIKKTPQEIIRLRPDRSVVWSDKYKTWREAWCVAKFCEIYNEQALITAPAEEPADVLLEIGSNKIKIQIVECKDEVPRGTRPASEIIPLYSDEEDIGNCAIILDKNYNQMIIDSISKKEKRYSSSDKQSIILLVYENIQNSYEDDIDLDIIKQAVNDTDFSAIIMFNGQSAFNLKGNWLA